MQIINFDKSYTKKLYEFIKNAKPHGYIDWIFEYDFFKNSINFKKNDPSKSLILIFSDQSKKLISGYCLIENKIGLGYSQLNLFLRDENYSNITQIINFLKKNSKITTQNIILASNSKEKTLTKYLRECNWKEVRKFYKLEKILPVNLNIKINEKFNIVKLEEKYSKELTDLQNSAFRDHWGYEKNIPKEIREEILNKHNLFFIHRSKDKSILGYIWIKQTQKSTSKINMLGIDPDYTGMGLGKYLLYYALKHQIANGQEKVILDVDSKNLKARKLYENFGFMQYLSLTWWEKKLD